MTLFLSGFLLIPHTLISHLTSDSLARSKVLAVKRLRRSNQPQHQGRIPWHFERHIRLARLRMTGPEVPAGLVLSICVLCFSPSWFARELPCGLVCGCAVTRSVYRTFHAVPSPSGSQDAYQSVLSSVSYAIPWACVWILGEFEGSSWSSVDCACFPNSCLSSLSVRHSGLIGGGGCVLLAGCIVRYAQASHAGL
jgi:hypothetical protein